jgi:UDPglucose 6-dehydrogenase
VIEELLEAGASVTAFDPEAREVARTLLPERVELAAGMYDALAGADALLIVTEWHEFRYPDFARIKAALRRPIVFDGRNIFPPGKMAQLGFTYVSMGRPAVRPEEGAASRGPDAAGAREGARPRGGDGAAVGAAARA